MANFSGVITVFLISQSAWGILYATEKVPFITQSPINLFVTGYLFIFGLFFLLLKILPSDANNKSKKRALVYYMCSHFAWSCVIDGISSLEACKYIKGFIGYYFVHGEPYLASTFGVFTMGWDSIINYVLYLIIIYRIDNGKNYQCILLFYLGNMISGMILLLGGVLMGAYAAFYPCTLLNIPYFVFPVYVFIDAINKPQSVSKKENSGKQNFNYGFLRMLCAVSIIGAMTFAFIRGLAALGSSLHPAIQYREIEPYITEPSKFGAMWVLQLMFIGTLIQTFQLYGLFHSGCEWMKDWSLFFAGFSVYGSVMQFCCQLCPGVNSQYHPPTETIHLVAAGNLFVGLSASLTALLCCIEPTFFSKSSIKKRQ